MSFVCSIGIKSTNFIIIGNFIIEKLVFLSAL